MYLTFWGAIQSTLRMGLLFWFISSSVMSLPILPDASWICSGRAESSGSNPEESSTEVVFAAPQTARRAAPHAPRLVSLRVDQRRTDLWSLHPGTCVAELSRLLPSVPLRC